MAFSLEGLVVRLSSQLASALEERDALRVKLRLVTAQASAAQTDKVALTRRLFSSASDGVHQESELRSMADHNQRLVDKLRAGTSSAHALRVAVSPRGRLASLFDRLFEQLEVSDTVEGPLQSSDTDTKVPAERKSRPRKRDLSHSPALSTTE